ncbi:hypothetical protein PAMP_007933 [Pampus punctatissimus]
MEKVMERKHITPDSYIPCLTDLCKALWEVMLSYHRTMQWHEEHDKLETTPTPEGFQLPSLINHNHLELVAAAVTISPVAFFSCLVPNRCNRCCSETVAADFKGE